MTGDVEQPPPDTKDWTWVLERTCPQCGYRAEAVDRRQLGGLFRANAAAFRSALSRGDHVARRPPVPPGQPPVWSALEYGAHVADIYELALERLTRMLEKDDPTFPDWDQDHAAIARGYAEADADRVAYRLAATAGQVADLIDRVGARQWGRTGTRSDGATFTIESFARYILHDVTHHLWDVEQGYEAIRKAAKGAGSPGGANGADGDGPDVEPAGDAGVDGHPGGDE